MRFDDTHLSYDDIKDVVLLTEEQKAALRDDEFVTSRAVETVGFSPKLVVPLVTGAVAYAVTTLLDLGPEKAEQLANVLAMLAAAFRANSGRVKVYADR